MFFCDCLGKLIVSLTTVPGSLKHPDHHAVHYCAQMAHSLQNMKYCDFCHVGQVLSPNLGHVLSLCSCFLAISLTIITQDFCVMIVRAVKGSPISLPQWKSLKMCPGAYTTKKIWYWCCGCLFVYSWWQWWMKCSFYHSKGQTKINNQISLTAISKQSASLAAYILVHKLRIGSQSLHSTFHVQAPPKEIMKISLKPYHWTHATQHHP